MHFINGMLWGVFLAILVGPLLFALIQTTIEKGAKYGVSVGFGIWFSDLLFILATYFGVNSIYKLTQWENFEITVGVFGGLILVIIGSFILFSKPPQMNGKVPVSEIRGLGSSFGLGFLINTFNPFTVLFWLGVMTTTVEEQGLDRLDTIWFASGIFAMIVFTDSVKIVFAQKIKKWLTPDHIILARKISGISLVIFGIILIGRVTFF